MSYNAEHFFLDFEIRDTNTHRSGGGYAGAFIPKTILFQNTHDEAVEITVFGCAKGEESDLFQINAAPIVVPANTNHFETLEDYFQCFFLDAKAPVAPTSGNFTAQMLMTSGNGRAT